MSDRGPPRQRVLVLYLADAGTVARVQRQVAFLAEEFDVVVAAFGGSHLPDITFVELAEAHPPVLRRRAEAAARIAVRMTGRYRRAYWLDHRVRRWRDALAHLRPDAVVVNDLFGLPLADAVAHGAPIVFDAQEHWTSESASWTRLQRLSMRGAHEWLLEQYVPRSSSVMTVSGGIARDYEARLGIRPALVTNAPSFEDLQPSAVTLPIRLLHIGVADERRRLEDTIDAVRMLDDRFTLDLILARDNAYRRRLERRAGTDGRIRVLPAVPTHELVATARAYDVGISLLPARYPNQLHILPNKLFDYIQARLAVAIGPSPEMARVVQTWDCGVVSTSFEPEEFAQTLGRLTVPEVVRMKLNSDRAAHVLNAEANRATVLNMVRDAIAAAGTTTGSARG